MKPSDKRLPLFHRLERALGRPFGRHWVGEDEVAVVYENDRFHALHRGPRFFTIDPLTQDVRAVINVAPDAIRVPFRGIQTRDGLPVDLEMGLMFDFAPERALHEITHLVVKWTREDRRDALCWRTRGALQKVLPAFTVDEVCRGLVFEEIERRTLSLLKDLVSGLGLEPTRMLLLGVTPPAELRYRFAEIAQRRANALDLAQYAPYELTQVMRAQIIEALSRMSPNRQYVEFPASPMDVAPPPSPPVIDAPQSPPHLSADAAPVADDEDAPSPPKKRPRSRLIP